MALSCSTRRAILKALISAGLISSEQVHRYWQDTLTCGDDTDDGTGDTSPSGYSTVGYGAAGYGT